MVKEGRNILSSKPCGAGVNFSFLSAVVERRPQGSEGLRAEPCSFEAEFSDEYLRIVKKTEVTEKSSPVK